MSEEGRCFERETGCVSEIYHEEDGKWLCENNHVKGTVHPTKKCPKCERKLVQYYEGYWECCKCTLRIMDEFINDEWPYTHCIEWGTLWKEHCYREFMIMGGLHPYPNEKPYQQHWILISCPNYSYTYKSSGMMICTIGKDSKGEWNQIYTSKELLEVLKELKAEPITDRRMELIPNESIEQHSEK